MAGEPLEPITPSPDHNPLFSSLFLPNVPFLWGLSILVNLIVLLCTLDSPSHHTLSLCCHGPFAACAAHRLCCVRTLCRELDLAVSDCNEPCLPYCFIPDLEFATAPFFTASQCLADVTLSCICADWFSLDHDRTNFQ